MKRLVLLLSFVISLTTLPFTNFAQTLDNTPLSICNVPPGCQQQPICTLSDDCFQFDYYGATDLGNGTSALKFRITNFSESTFKLAAFELPGDGVNTNPAVKPNNKFANRYNHNVINPYQDSVIVFNAKNAGTFSYGGFEVYYYVVNNADLNSPHGRFATVQARAGRPWQMQRTGTVRFDLVACGGGGQETDCLVQESDNFKLMFPNFAADGDGNAAMYFKLINKTSSDVEYIDINSSSAVILPLNGSAYSSPFNSPAYTYDVTVNSPLRFTRTVAPPSTIGFANGLRDQFNFSVVNTDFGNSGALITVTVKAGDAIESFLFECAECGDFPITPLPVTLTSFNGKGSSEGIALDWATASEKENDRFEIERSFDGRNFEKIGTVKGHGTTNTAQRYAFLDRNPQKGINYYRLRQVDFGGESELSKLLHVKYGVGAENLAIAVVPNPCQDGQCDVRLSGIDTSQPVSVEVSDLTGRRVFSKQLAADQSTFDMPKLDSGRGIYILTARNGKQTSYQKIILQ